MRISTLFRVTFMRMSTLFRATFLFGDFLGEEMFCFCGGIFGGFYNFVGGIFLRNLIYYDEYETCGFDFCADGGGAAVGGSK